MSRFLRAKGASARSLVLCALLAAPCSISMLAPSAHAQLAGTGTIQGTVNDASGAILPNATVTLTETSTGVKRTAASDKAGLFNFPNINVGTYSLSVTMQGFKTYKQDNITLEVGSNLGINVDLPVGGQNEEVTVEANGIALQTEDASFKQTIDQKTVTELPLSNRQVTGLIQLSGASVPATALTQGNKGFFSSVSPQIAGGQGNQTDYRLDGGDNNDYMSNTSFAFPFPDAVSQFSVETAALSADAGLHPAGTVNAVTRSGTNKFHGDAFEFIRNNYINASNFFSASNDTLHQNQFGGVIGGPVIKDRLFFFFGYQRLNSSSSSASTTAQVPTAANLAGDFSVTDSYPCATNLKSGQQYTLLNPQTGAALNNDQINPSTFNAAALQLAKLLPAPYDQCGNVKYAIPVLQTENQYITREDWTISKTHQLYARYFSDDYITPALYSATDILVTNNPGNTERAQTLTVGENWTISSKMVNSVHITGTRRANTRGPAAQGINAASLGINVYQPYAIGLRVQEGKFNTYCSTCAPGVFNVNSYSVIDDVNLVLGRHQIIFGGEYIRPQENINNSFSANGNFTFNGQFSQKGPALNVTTALPGAEANLDFLEGALYSYSQSKPQQNALRAPIPSVYIQDTYHISPRVVLTGGVRWGAQVWPTDYFGRGSTFSQSAFNANQHSVVFPNAPAGSLFYGDPGVPKNFTNNSWTQFSPRVAVTFDPVGDGKTVFRAGSGLVFDETNFFAASEVNYNPPYSTLVLNTATTSGPLPFQNPWATGTAPSNPFPMPFAPPSNTVFGPSLQYITYGPNFRSPYVVSWTASMQHELGKGWDIQLIYIGNKTTHQPYGYPTSPAVYIPGTWTGAGSCGALTVSPGTGKPCSSTGNQANRFLLTLLNPTQGVGYQGGGGGGGSTEMISGSNARYDGLVGTIEHRASKSFTFLANYTWSHCFDLLDNPGQFNTVAVQNPNNIHGDYAACGFDRRNMFNAAIVAESQFHINHLVDAVVDHWELAPIIRATSGAPFTVTSGTDNSLTDLGTDRPNQVSGNVYTSNKITGVNTNNSQVYINASAFVQNPTGTYGTVGRNTFVGPKYLQFDSSLVRTFPVWERVALQLRLEAFNVLNHPNFNNPASSALNSSSFGKITGQNGNPRQFQAAAKFTF